MNFSPVMLFMKGPLANAQTLLSFWAVGQSRVYIVRDREDEQDPESIYVNWCDSDNECNMKTAKEELF